jgi:hypothetical protein
MNEKHTRKQMLSGTFLACLLMAGCTGAERAAMRTPTPVDAPPTAAVAVAPAATPGNLPVASASDQNALKAAPPVARQSTKVSPVSAPAMLPPVRPPSKKADAVASPAKPAAGPPPLDLALLEKRLRETQAIGVFTKIALKNQVDDLLNKFRAYYQGRTKASLAELRQPYEMLLLKVLSVLQDGDPALARSIVASREVIWGVLVDPNKFATIKS